MALKDLFESFGDTLEDAFNAKPFDPAKGRARLVRGIQGAREAIAAGRTRGTNRWWSVSNGIVAFTARVGEHPVVINGKSTNYIPVDRFGEFADALVAEVEAGSFDSVIEGVARGSGNAGVSVPVTPRRTRGPMSEEAKANIRAGRARAKAEREAAAKG